MEEQRRSILDQILEPAAKDRLVRLALVKKEKARMMEDHLLKAATSGQLRSKVQVLHVLKSSSHDTVQSCQVSEEQLITMLEGAETSSGTGKIKIQRRNYGLDSDDDDDDI